MLFSTRPFRFLTACFLVAVLGAPVAAQSQGAGTTQFLVVGDPSGAPNAPSELPVLTMTTLPEAAAAEGEVFAALLRSNPVSTFVATPDAASASFTQFFLTTRLGLMSGTEGFSVELGGETLPLAAFAERMGAVVEAFTPEHRRMAFLEIDDPEDRFPQAVPEVQAALEQIGFDMNVLMIRNTATAEGCAAPSVHLDLLSGVADRAPFGDADGVSSMEEVESYLQGALARLAAREDSCAPAYNLVLKGSEAPSAQLIVHAGLPSFPEIETRLYHETFEARFLMKSEDQVSVQGFLDSCLYCPMADELNARLEGMHAFKLASQLEDEIWDRIKDDTVTARLEIYLENCTLCAHRAETEARMTEIGARVVAREEEIEQFRIAAEARDLPALEVYVTTCIACAEKPAAAALIAEIRNDVAYRAERSALEAAVAARDTAALNAYLAECKVCDGTDDAKAALAEAARLAQLSQPCLAAAGVPQMGGPRKLEDINQTAARSICGALLAEFPGDGLLTTVMGRIAQAAGNADEAASAYEIGMETGTPTAFGLAAYLAYAPLSGRAADYDAAEDLAVQGAEMGDWLSKEILTVLYSKDLIPGKSSVDAYQIALGMADEGNPLAQFFVGYFHQTGTGAEASPEEAERWLAKSVEQGYLHAFSFLAELYEDSDGILPAPERAAELYWTALKEGDPTARDRLTVQLDSRDQQVIRLIQQKLRDEGVYTGGIDGIAGPGTVAAITRYAQAVQEAG